MRAFDWAATLLGAAFTGGLFLDGWAHTHGRVDDTFFTPWHAVLYSAFLAMAVLHVGRLAWGFRRTGRWREALPPGYGLGLVGVGCWVVGGPFDAVWHEVFGFEANVEALMSPAHAVLALGYGLMAAGPLRAGLKRPRARWIDELPIVLSLTYVVSNLTFFTQTAHPIANVWAARRPPTVDVELAITSLLLTAVVLAGSIVFLLRCERLPAGGVTIVIGLNAIAMGFLYDRGPYPADVVVAMVVGAALTDALCAWLRPRPVQPGSFRLVATALPVLLYVSYFVAVGAGRGIAWSPHLWLGVIVFAGVLGWLLSYLVLAPRHAPTVTP
jgi:hypothetical protein